MGLVVAESVKVKFEPNLTYTNRINWQLPLSPRAFQLPCKVAPKKTSVIDHSPNYDYPCAHHQ